VKKTYVIQKRIVLAQRTEVFWYAGPHLHGGSRWMPGRDEAHRLTFKDAAALVKRFNQMSSRFGDFNHLYSKEPA